MSCDLCAFAKVNGWWGPGLATNETHCRDCHRTFRKHHHHCTRCHETFGGASAANRHNPGGSLTQCHDPEAKGLFLSGVGSGVAWSRPMAGAFPC